MPASWRTGPNSTATAPPCPAPRSPSAGSRAAITNALAAYDDLDDPYVLYLGPETAGTRLEVLTAVDEQGEEIASHAMPMRRKYTRLLP